MLNHIWFVFLILSLDFHRFCYFFCCFPVWFGFHFYRYSCFYLYSSPDSEDAKPQSGTSSHTSDVGMSLNSSLDFMFLHIIRFDLFINLVHPIACRPAEDASMRMPLQNKLERLQNHLNYWQDIVIQFLKKGRLVAYLKTVFTANSNSIFLRFSTSKCLRSITLYTEAAKDLWKSCT